MCLLIVPWAHSVRVPLWFGRAPVSLMLQGEDEDGSSDRFKVGSGFLICKGVVANALVLGDMREGERTRAA